MTNYLTNLKVRICSDVLEFCNILIFNSGTDPGRGPIGPGPPTYYFPNFFNNSTDPDITRFKITCTSDNIIYYYKFYSGVHKLR